MNPVGRLGFVPSLLFPKVISLLADAEHLGGADRAGALGRRLAILHFNGFGILYFSLGAALNTISLH